ncbi:MAG: FHA domain-containing protein [Gammaproteobacteria bacterium]
MARLSNPQGILFIEQCVVLSMHDTHSGWMTRAESGRARFRILDLVVAGRGVVVETKDDIIQCAFASAQAAFDAALCIQAEFAPPSRSAKRRGTTVRQALVYGQLTVVNARSEGEVLNQGMRILEEAEDGEILVSQEALVALSNAAHIQALTQAERRADLSIHALDEWALRTDEDMPAEEILVDAQEVEAEEVDVAHFDLGEEQEEKEPTSVSVELEAETLLDKPDDEIAIIDLDGAEAPSDVGPDQPEARDSSANQPPRADLVVSLKSADQEWSFDRDQAPVLIGRGSDCQVRVKNPHVSRRHAQIRWTETGLVLMNLSGNGTAVRFSDDPEATAHPTPVDLNQSGDIALNSSFESDNAEIIHFEVRQGS